MYQEQAEPWTVQDWIYRTDLSAGEIKALTMIHESSGPIGSMPIVHKTGMTFRHIRLCLIKLKKRGAILELACDCGCKKKCYAINHQFFLDMEELSIEDATF